MQIQELNTQGYEVILVTSGAVGVGRQRLRYRKLVNSRLLLFCPPTHIQSKKNGWLFHLLIYLIVSSNFFLNNNTSFYMYKRSCEFRFISLVADMFLSNMVWRCRRLDYVCNVLNIAVYVYKASLTSKSHKLSLMERLVQLLDKMVLWLSMIHYSVRWISLYNYHTSAF